jgi:hypothetical protein
MMLERKIRMYDRDFTHCEVCGTDMPPDRLHVIIDNGIAIRSTYCCPKHRYRTVEYVGKAFVQERTDREIENLAFKFRAGELKPSWE